MPFDGEEVGAPRGRAALGRDRRLIRGCLLLTAAVNLAWRAYSIINLPPTLVQEGGLTINIDYNGRFLFMKTRIALALVTAAAASLFRRTEAVAVSVLALAWGVGEYLKWWVDTYRMVKASEHETYAKINHFVFLAGANWWDVLVFVMIAVLLVAQFKMVLNWRKLPS